MFISVSFANASGYIHQPIVAGASCLYNDTPGSLTAGSSPKSTTVGASCMVILLAKLPLTVTFVIEYSYHRNRITPNTSNITTTIVSRVLIILFFRDGVLTMFDISGPYNEHWLAASIAIMAMTYGDGFGSVVGRRIGKHKIIHGKSLEGSIGVFCATTIMACVMFALFNAISGITFNGITYLFDTEGIIPWFVIAPLAGLLSAVLEALCNGDYDNFVNPIIIGLMLVALGL